MSADPKRIGRYVIEGALGRGAMGVIYRAHDPDIDRPIAIKLIRADLLDGGERANFIARFRREAQAAGRCAHPNIVAIYDFALHEGNPFLAMEFVDGVTLAQARDRDARFAPEDAVFVMLQVLTALGAAHAMGIVHRDIKPANIMLTADSRVKVTDFGISRLDTSHLTQDGAIIGTPSYMSPEQCRGRAVDARTDLFSSGVVLFELLAGQKPFTGQNAVEVFERLLHHPAPDIRDLCPGLTAAMADALARSLAKDPAERFASAGEMSAALRDAAAESGTLVADRTIVLPLRPAAFVLAPPTLETSGSFDRELIDTLERKLTEFVGPIARHLVRSAVRTSDSMGALCASLAASIDQPAQRVMFEREVEVQMARSTAATAIRTAMPAGGAIPPEEAERAQKELARYAGPVARVLVKRAMAGAVSSAALWHALAEQIDDPVHRAAFLKKAPS